MGGSDQWGNMTTGTELIRRKCGGEAFVFTNPLVTKSGGGKFGKTEAGNIWLDPTKTSPYQFYQFWLNTSDADATRWIKLFTFLTRDEIEKITDLHLQNPATRTLQRKLAAEITQFVHGKEELEKAIETTEKLFSNQQAPIESLSATDLQEIQGVVKVEIDRSLLEEGVDIVSLLANTGVFPSKGEARKTVQGGGVSINRKKVESIELKVTTAFLLHNRYILIQKGKKNYFLITVKAV
jgi:tyrosyl-tRNA synthetase